MISPLSSLAPDLKEQLPASAILGLSVASFGSGMSMRVADSMLVKLADTFAINLAIASLISLGNDPM